MAAQHTGNPALVPLFLDVGYDPNAVTDDGWTPLLLAVAFNDNPAVSTALINRGANPNVSRDDGWTPLHWAARYSADFSYLQDGIDPRGLLSLVRPIT